MQKLSSFFPTKTVRWLLPVSFLLGLLVSFPAERAWFLVGAAQYLPPQVDVKAIKGRLWQGDALVAIQAEGPPLNLQLSWQLGLGALWQQGEWLALTLKHPGTLLQLTASPSLNLQGGHGELQGHLHPLLLNPLLKQNNAWISGEIRIPSLAFRLAEGRPVALDGSVIWQGGDTYFIPPGQSVQRIRYPQLALQANTVADGHLQGVVTQLGVEGALVEAALQPDGWFSARVNGRLKQAVPQLPVPQKPADQALIKYKEKVL